MAFWNFLILTCHGRFLFAIIPTRKYFGSHERRVGSPRYMSPEVAGGLLSYSFQDELAAMDSAMFGPLLVRVDFQTSDDERVRYWLTLASYNKFCELRILSRLLHVASWYSYVYLPAINSENNSNSEIPSTKRTEKCILFPIWCSSILPMFAKIDSVSFDPESGLTFISRGRFRHCRQVPMRTKILCRRDERFRA